MAVNAILVVEDYPNLLNPIEYNQIKVGYDVATGIDGAEAMAIA